MNIITKELIKLERLLKEKNIQNYALLEKPLADEEILSYLEKLNIKDDNVYNLYKWRNGVNIDEVKSRIFVYQTAMLSLQNVYYYNERNKVEQLIDDGFLMIFSNGEDSFLFNNNSGEDYGKIYLNMNVPTTFESPLSYYDSLLTMITTTNVLYEANVLSYDSDADFLDTDFESCAEISAQLNPQSDFFNENEA